MKPKPKIITHSLYRATTIQTSSETSTQFAETILSQTSNNNLQDIHNKSEDDESEGVPTARKQENKHQSKANNQHEEKNSNLLAERKVVHITEDMYNDIVNRAHSRKENETNSN